MALDYRILGPLEVRRDGAPLAPGAPRERAVLAILLLHSGEVVTLDDLLDRLWNGSPPPTAKAVLQNAVSALRRRLGAEAIETVGGGYRIAPAAGAHDAIRFEELLADAKHAPPQTRAARLREALALWRGRPLADVAIEIDATAEIARLEELHLHALEARIEADLELGREADLVAELESLVLRNPLREGFWRQLMLALYRSGRQAEALDAYRRAHRAFVDELGLEPSPPLRDLQRAILVQDPALEGADDPFERVAALLPTDDVRRSEALLDYAVALSRVGDGDRAQRVFREAIRRAEAAGAQAVAERARVALESMVFTTRMQPLAGHLEAVGHSIVELRRLDDPKGLATAYHLEGTILRELGRLAEAEAAYVHGIACAQTAGDAWSEGVLRNFCGIAVALGPRPVDEAIAECSRHLDALTWGLPGPTGLLASLGLLHAQAGRVEEGRQLMTDAIRRHESAGIGNEQVWLRRCAAWLEERAGELAAAERLTRSAYDLLASLKGPRGNANLAASLARACALVGRSSEVGALVENAKQTAHDALETQVEWRLAIAIAGARVRPADALAAAEEAEALTRTTDWTLLRAWVLETVALVASRASRDDRTDEALAELAELHAGKGDVLGVAAAV